MSNEFYHLFSEISCFKMVLNKLSVSESLDYKRKLFLKVIAKLRQIVCNSVLNV